jgi:hypothetical protein
VSQREATCTLCFLGGGWGGGAPLFSWGKRYPCLRPPSIRRAPLAHMSLAATGSGAAARAAARKQMSASAPNLSLTGAHNRRRGYIKDPGLDPVIAMTRQRRQRELHLGQQKRAVSGISGGVLHKILELKTITKEIQGKPAHLHSEQKPQAVNTHVYHAAECDPPVHPYMCGRVIQIMTPLDALLSPNRT